MENNLHLSDYKHVNRIKIRYDDLDTFNHVNNKAYLAYLEEARIDYHKQLFEWKGHLEFNAVVARVEINYIQPVFYGDDLSLYTRTSNIGNKSFELETVFVVNKNQALLKVADAKVVLVAIDPKTGKTRTIPEKEKEVLLKYEGKI